MFTVSNNFDYFRFNEAAALLPRKLMGLVGGFWTMLGFNEAAALLPRKLLPFHNLRAIVTTLQ